MRDVCAGRGGCVGGIWRGVTAPRRSARWRILGGCAPGGGTGPEGGAGSGGGADLRRLHPVPQEQKRGDLGDRLGARAVAAVAVEAVHHGQRVPLPQAGEPDRKSTRLNSSHLVISYAVFCLKKKKNIIFIIIQDKKKKKKKNI